MDVDLDAIRVYRSFSSPGMYDGTNPIVIDNYPAQDERLEVHFGAVPEHILTAYARASARATIFLEQMFRGRNIQGDIEDTVDQLAVEPQYVVEASGYNWLLTVVVHRTCHVSQDDELIPALANFRAYAFDNIDLLVTHLATVLPPNLFTTRLVPDRVFFSREEREMLTLPAMSGSATASVQNNRPLDHEGIETLIRRLSNAPLQTFDWMRSFKSWYVNAMSEEDPWKKFMWSFFCLEILTNKLAKKFYDTVVGGLSIRDSLDVELPLGVLVSSYDRLNLKAKFTIVASHLSPDTAKEDTDKFGAIKSFRDNLSHGGLVDESQIPNDVLVLVHRYLQNAVERLLP